MPGTKKVKGEKEKRKISVLGVLLILALVFALGAGTLTFSRYSAQSREKALAEARNFHFSSNYLTAEGSDYSIYDWSEGFAVDLRNFENGAVSAVDIGYTVSVTDGTAMPASGTLTKAEQSTQTIRITPTAGAGSLSVSVSTTPYSKTLSATFTLKDAGADSIRR